jgi:hypothetical protein
MKEEMLRHEKQEIKEERLRPEEKEITKNMETDFQSVAASYPRCPNCPLRSST